MISIIREMANKNIGSLSLFLNNDKNIDYLEYVNKNIPKEIIGFKISEKIYYLLNGINELLLCECGKHRSFIGFKNGYRITCGDKICSIKKRKETCVIKYGVDNPKKNKDILKKERENIRNKWGVDHYMQSENIINKIKSKMLDRYGVEWAQQSEEIKLKSKKTWNENPNKDLIIENRKKKLSNGDKVEIENKKRKTIEKKWGSYEEFIKYRSNCIRNSSHIKYGVDHHFKDKNIISKRIESYKKNILNKIKKDLPNNLEFIYSFNNKNCTDTIFEFKCNKCDQKFDINRQLFQFRKSSNVEICLNCNPILFGKSKKELEVLDFIKNNYNGVIKNNSKDLFDLELDIYLPEKRISFEFNGLYWHSDLYKDKYYHTNKSKKCINSQNELFHIWEDDWDYKKDIVKSMIFNKIGRSEKIFARKCEIKEITNTNLIREFLNKNHIQGFTGSKIKLGLYYNGELVSLMTFGLLRKSLGNKSIKNIYEMVRFCNKLNTTVIGGASKLFRYFIKTYPVQEIISYSDSSRSNGNLYKKLGFKYIHETEPNYYWIIDGVRKHRFNYRKDVLVKKGFDKNKTEVQIMNEMGYYRIFDCGSKKWSFKVIEHILQFKL